MIHQTRLLRAVRAPTTTCLARRCYSVRILSDESHPQIKTLSDLKSWTPQKETTPIELSGWVRSVRKSSGVRFVDIIDGSSMRPVQAVVEKSLSSEMRPGAAVRLKGTWVAGSDADSVLSSSIRDAPQRDAKDPASPTDDAVHQSASGRNVSGVDTTQSKTSELRVSNVEILGASDPQTYPIQNKYQSPESLRSISHLRPRMPLNSTMLRMRSDATALLTQFFFQEGFQQSHTPIITSSDCEGAGEAFTIKAGTKEEFFKDQKYLTVSAQLHLEAMAQALGNVWTMSPTFRAEQSDTSRHLAEFYMVEAEMSFVQDMDEVMDLLQRMLTSLAQGLKTRTAAKELANNRLDAKDPTERLAFEDLVDRDQLQRRWRGLLSPNRWPRITYTEAIEMLKPVAHKFEYEPEWTTGLQTEHEKYLAEKLGYDESTDAYMPVFITHYPRQIKAFYMPQSATPSAQGPTVDCFDLLVPALGELAGGSMREHRLVELEDNMRLHGLEVPEGRKARRNNMSWYLDLRRWGCPPHGGFGLGFDRLLSYLTGVPNVRDIVPFPRYWQRCDC